MKRIILLLLLILPTFLRAQSTLSVLRNMHEVVKGETVESVAQKYGITPEQLLKANPDMKVKKNKLKKGTLLVIPEPEKVEAKAVEETPAEQKPVILTKYETVRLAVLLPLEEKSERASKLVEFYQGLLMAADSVKSEGTNIEIFTYHVGSTEEELREVLNQHDISGMNVVIGPADQAQIPYLSDYCTQNNVRLVIPFSAPNANTVGHPLQYIVTTGGNLLQQEAAAIIGEKYTNRNYVLLKSGNPDERGTNLVEALRDQLNKYGVSMRQLAIDGDEFAIESSLNQFRENCIVPDNTSIRTLNLFFAQLKTFCQTHNQYKISMLGYPEWQTYTANLLNEFYTYDTYLYSAYYRNPLLRQTADFERQFSANFHHSLQPTFPRYGMLGFDMGYYFLHGLAQMGDTFELRQSEMQLTPYQSSFSFQQDGEGNGFTNRAVLLVHYTPEQKIEIIK